MEEKNNQSLMYGVIGLLAGIILSMFVFPSWGFVAGPMGNMMGSWYGSRGMMNISGNNVDQHFIEQMIPHHEDAIAMAEVALQKAEHSQIKILANDIIKAQSEEIEKMQEWYKSWFGNEAPVIGSSIRQGMNTMMRGGMMGDATDIDRLENAKPFDKAFIEEMIPHHQMAVMMAQMLERTTSRSEMKQLAQDIISSQTKEINQMRSWYRDWYK